MKNKKLLAIILLSLSLCFVSGAGYGEIQEWINEVEISTMDFILLKEHVRYIMQNPTSFLNIDVFYDPDKRFGWWFPDYVDTEKKICIRVQDSRDVFSSKVGETLLDEFKKQLELVYWSLKVWATNMDTDIVAIFHDNKMSVLGYFSEGEYHLWDE